MGVLLEETLLSCCTTSGERLSPRFHPLRSFPSSKEALPAAGVEPSGGLGRALAGLR